LTGKYKSQDIPVDGRYSDSQGALGSWYRTKYFKDSIFEAVTIIEAAAAKDGLSLVEVGFRWLRHHSALKMELGSDGILIGVSTLDQLKSNLDAIESGPLSDNLLEALDEAWRLCKTTASPYWFFDLEYGYDTRKVLFNE
jgi:aflatoxin B1 aldehyde reductase